MNPIPDLEWNLLEPIGYESMIELGDKYSLRHKMSYKEFFEAGGVQHTSVDWNGAHGALSLDLRELHELPQADVVTNFGCTEHVDPQGEVWHNVVNWIKPGGYLVSVTPVPGGWPWHGIHYPPGDWYVEFCNANGLSIEALYLAPNRPVTKNLWCLRARKVEDKPFFMPGGMFINQIRR